MALLATAVLVSAGAAPPCTCAEELPAPVGVAIEPWRPLEDGPWPRAPVGLERARVVASRLIAPAGSSPPT
jgi:hypothetical protein